MEASQQPAVSWLILLIMFVILVLMVPDTSSMQQLHTLPLNESLMSRFGSSSLQG
jgi:hypothetical protein